MQKLLLVFFLFLTQIVFAQRGFLYVKKKGFKKVKTFEEGNVIKLETKDGQVVYGILAIVKKSDSLYINGHWFITADIKKLILRERKFCFDSKLFLLTTGRRGNFNSGNDSC